MKFNRRQGLKGVLGAMAGSMLGATPREAAAQSRAETLRQVMGGIVNTLDPTVPGGTRETYGLAMSTYDRLASFGRKQVDGNWVFDLGTIRGELAETIDRAPDVRSFTFHLRQGATWHDGSPVTAEDVKWSLDRAVSAKSLAPTQLAGGSLSKPEQFRIVGDRAVEVMLDKPDRLSLANLCVPFAMMINSKLAKQHATDDDPWALAWLKENQAGGGAYIVDVYKPGQQVTLRRNEAWKNGMDGMLPFFRRVIVQTVSEAATRASLMERGDADIAIDLAASDVQGVQQRGGKVKLVSVPQTNGFTAAVFNTQMAPFDNPKIRQAVAAALPYGDMFKAALFGRGRPLFGGDWTEAPNGLFPQPMPLRTDLGRAKALLAEAGMKDGFATSFSFAAGTAAVAEPVGSLIKEALGKIGIQVTVQKLPDAEMTTMEVSRRLPFFIESGSAWLPAPDYFEPDPGKYRAGCQRMVTLLGEQVPQAMLWQANQDAAMAAGIDGYTYWFHRQVGGPDDGYRGVQP